MRHTYSIIDETGAFVDLTDYACMDGVCTDFWPVDEELAHQIRKLGSGVVMTAEIIEGLAQVVKAMNADADARQERRQRAMNTTMRYPTSTPPWSRRKR